MSKTISINGKNYILFKLLGKGSFGEVYLTQKERTRELFATKVINLNQKDIKRLLKYLNYELLIMKELRNRPNIVHLYDNFCSANHCYVVMEYCNGGSLTDCLKKYGKPFPQEIIQYFMRQIVNGLKYIHSKRIIHRDIKMDNILVKFKNMEDLNNFRLLNSEIKIIDFGLATRLGPDGYAYTFIGSPINMDPHILEGFNEDGKLEKLQKYNEKADIWSLGTICFQMLTGNTVFKAKNFQELIIAARNAKYDLPIKYELSNEIISFINSMLQYYGDMRLSAEEISQHPFLTKNVKDFTKADLSKINNKIYDGYIHMDSKKNNKSIYDAFNSGQNKVIKSGLKRDKSEKIMIGKRPINDKETELINLENVEKKIKEIKNKEAVEKEQFKKKFEDRLKIQPEKIFNNKILEQWHKYLSEILEEYQEAQKYFGENNLKAQEEDAGKKCLEIQKLKNDLDLGIQLKNAPSQVTPEYIYGYTQKERNEKFKQIFNKYLQDKNNLYLKINSNKKYNIIASVREEIENDELKMKKLDFIIKSLKERYKNVWIPAPEFTKEYENCLVRKVSFENENFSMKIKIKKMDNNKFENINMKLTLKINELKHLYKEIFLNSANKFSDEWNWNLNFQEWKNVDNNSSNYILSINYIISNLNYKVELGISKIMNGKVCSYNLLIPKSNNDNDKIYIEIIPIFPTGKKYYTTEKKCNLIIKTIFPAFIGKSPLLTNNIKH